MARYPYRGHTKTGNGKVITSATISVYLAGTDTAANVYTSETGGSPVNSVTSDSTTGYFIFWVDEASYSLNQKFKIKISKSNFRTQTYDNIQIYPKVQSNYYYVDYNESDQGAAGSGYSVKDIVDSVGSTNAVMVFRNNSGSATTTYTFSTDETILANIKVVVEPGALLSPAAGVTLTIAGPLDAPIMKIFSGSGTVAFTAGHLTELYPNWWGFDVSASASTNDTAFTACLNAALSAGIDIKLTAGTFSLNPIKYTFTDSTTQPGICIEGQGSAMTMDTNRAKTLLDFSGLSNTGSDVALEFETTGTGSLVGMSFKNLSLRGPGNVTANTTKGIYVNADISTGKSGGLNWNFENVGLTNFNTGLHITGANNFTISSKKLNFQNCETGLYINNLSNIGSWIDCDFANTTYSVILDKASNQTFINPRFEDVTHGMIIDGTNGYSFGVTVINPYFEPTISGDGFRLGYDKAGNKTSSGAVNMTIIGGRSDRSDFTGVPIRTNNSNTIHIHNFRPVEYADQYVKNGGTVYFCIADHTSSASDEPGVGANWANYWEAITDGNTTTAPDWVSGKSYKQNDIYGGLPNSFVVSGKLGASNAVHFGDGGKLYSLRNIYSTVVSVNKGGTNQAIATGTWTKVTWSTEDFDTDNLFASDRFTPTQEGYYLIEYHVQWQSSVDQKRHFISVYDKNGATIKSSSFLSSSTDAYQDNHLAVIVYADGSTDYFEFYARQDTGGTVNISGAAEETYLTITRVG